MTVDWEPCLFVEGWPESLRGGLIDLVFGAVDALPRGGAIALDEETQGDAVVVEVSDTGAGMDSKTQERIFEPFFTTKGERGPGLGLAMVHQIVELHQGTIRLRSFPSVGTTFTLTFPATESAQTKFTQHSWLPRTRQPSLLVVDDDRELAGMLAILLAIDGHARETAYSGE